MARTLALALWSLIKPRIVVLLCLTGTSGLLAAGGLEIIASTTFVIAGGLIAAGAAAFNCYYDRDLDRHMERTADRPLPSGDLNPRVALAFTLGLLAVGTLVGVLTLPAISVAYMHLGALAYIGLYTVLLKRRHWMGVVLGGSAGSFPVLAGWAAVRPLETPALVMAAVVFVWTPAHAWALAFVYRDDFAAASVPTLPVVADEERVRWAVWASALGTVGMAVLLVPLSGGFYVVALAVAAPLYLFAFRMFYRTGTEPVAVRAFFTSNLFVATVFGAWAVDGVVGSVPGTVLVVESLSVAALFGWLWRSSPRLRGVPGAGIEGWQRPIERLGRLLSVRDRPG